ncbi:SDR family NAD(P)-dependent oxidoreductase [Halopenitus persicus]|uniref:SDR family NAD(P)-dependent oxidoreductase n=1 Tax=Halopenitus persicus TaxID=1048396 RepID=UPI000BBB5595|nr:SDR family oxidoreductase [Halopenitus persicus]
MERADKTALITGGSRGIGYELAKLCAQDGYDVVLVARHQEPLERAADALESTWGITTMTIPKDLSRPESAREIHDELRHENIHVDILVNNAAARPTPARFDETDLEITEDLIRTNVVTLTNLTRRFVAPMVERGAGRILNVSSVAGELPSPPFGVYAATKGYVSTLSTVLARQLEPAGITVTVLVPGWTDTEMAWDAFEALDIDPETREILSPEDVAKAGYDGLLSGHTHVIPGQQYREAIRSELTTRASDIGP